MGLCLYFVCVCVSDYEHSPVSFRKLISSCFHFYFISFILKDYSISDISAYLNNLCVKDKGQVYSQGKPPLCQSQVIW